MKIMFLYSHDGQIVTGGQKYEDLLYRIMKDDPRMEVDRRWIHNKNTGLKKYLYMFPNLRYAARLKGYDLVIFNSAQGLYFILLIWLLRLMGVRTAVVHHHFMFHQNTGIKRSYYKLVESSFIRGAAETIVPSPYIYDLCRRMFPRRDIRYWQIPFDAVPVAAKGTPQAGNLLYIGTIEARKGLDLLLEAMTMLKKQGVDCRLTIVGKTVEAGYRESLDRMVSDEQLNVRFTGYVSDEELQRIISETDIFTFPSRLEGYGMVICESMVNGLPVICFDNSAMPYTVKDGVNGLLVPDGDSEAFAGAVARVVKDRALRDRLSKGALETADSFMTPARFRDTVRRETEEMMLKK